MKKSGFIIVLTLFTSYVALVSCKKDKNVKENSFTFDGETYQTPHGYIKSIASTSNSSVHYVYLCSSGLELLNGAATGSGDYLMLSFASDSPDKLISGEYSYNKTLYAYFWIGINSNSSGGNDFGLDGTGTSTATVNVASDTYEIEYSIAVPSSKTIKGYYKGSLEVITGF
jgi:hypothetical protein